MNIFENISNIYFTGIGGIGMSALARYFLGGGFTVGGYDRTRTELCSALIDEGCDIVFDDDPGLIRTHFRDKGNTVLITTPAIPPSNNILSWFRENGYKIYKRAEILGEISKQSNTIAIAGTHGKTSVSTLTAHLMKQSSADCSAFLGGISLNYNTNMLSGKGNITVIEADEFDRSFHYLQPYLSAITSIDPDHLDVYGNYDNLLEAFNHFATLTRRDGSILINSRIRNKIRKSGNIRLFTYGLDNESDFRIENLRIEEGAYNFDFISPFGRISDLKSFIPGKLNLENSIAAIGLAVVAGAGDFEIRKALLYYRGVKRRFDVRFDRAGVTYIDDYAHHPAELEYFIESVKEFYGKRRITLIFQPHLYSRTRDHAAAFGKMLARADSVVLLPVYPARELPIEGVTSEIIAERMTGADCRLMNMEDIPGYLKQADIDILLTVGAGDIDTLVRPIENLLKERLK
ncbi:MAG: Mur ligase family protein [Marinilabiliaceae bacterium]|jgi:UDP-N-acetylmuramate--alanine ligase|nr:Mur ligase family protein [Marinilabiliaceae bacterium]